jgi:hypothetical protein
MDNGATFEGQTNAPVDNRVEAVPYGSGKDVPYLSVVVTARNDDHGGSPLRRLQIFVNQLAAQAVSHQVPLELVLVDWNPPEERPRLAQAIRWPAVQKFWTVRVIEVPAELHQQREHADRLPLFQMIAKNVGIRRSRGEFVLATNIDVLFSEEFFDLLAKRELEPGRMYRLDRYDVDSGVPLDAPVAERLAYCRGHLLRINSMEGTFPLTADGLRMLDADDIAGRDSGISLGRGWCGPEQHGGERFRWVSDKADLILRPERTQAGLALDLEPGPGTAYGAFGLEVLNSGKAAHSRFEIRGRTVVTIKGPFHAGETVTLRLCVSGGGRRFPGDPRIINFRVFRCEWGELPSALRAQTVSPLRAGWRFVYRKLVAGGRFLRGAAQLAWQLPRASSALRVGLPVTPSTLRRHGVRLGPEGLSFVLNPSKQDAQAEAAAARLEELRNTPPVHTNACGDFTLLSKEDWMDLRGYPEFNLYSLHIDSMLCYAAQAAGLREKDLTDPVRMYHIEHSAGSGWTPEGEKALFERLQATGVPWLKYSEVVCMADEMNRLKAPMIFNRRDWGLANVELKEICPQA